MRCKLIPNLCKMVSGFLVETSPAWKSFAPNFLKIKNVKKAGGIEVDENNIKI